MLPHSLTEPRTIRSLTAVLTETKYNRWTFYDVIQFHSLLFLLFGSRSRPKQSTCELKQPGTGLFSKVCPSKPSMFICLLIHTPISTAKKNNFVILISSAKVELVKCSVPARQPFRNHLRNGGAGQMLAGRECGRWLGRPGGCSP